MFTPDWISPPRIPEPLVYPVLEAHLTYHEAGTVKDWMIPSCCFHDLWSAPDEELAGMGLAILGNLVKYCHADLYNERLGATLLLKRHPEDAGVTCPWPGMPDDRPLPLDLMQLPFDAAMFLDDANFTTRVDRLALMARIEAVWVPWLKSQMQHSMVS